MAAVTLNDQLTHVFAPADPDSISHGDLLEEPESPLEENEDSSPRKLGSTIDALPKPRPEASRTSTDSAPSALLQIYLGSISSTRPTSSHRNRSPYPRAHLRSRSSGAALSAPLMTRAHSSPAVHSATQSLELSAPSNGSLPPGSPMRSPARQRSPFKPQEDSNYNPPPRSPSWFETSGGGAIESIQEDSELAIRPRHQLSQPTPMLAPFARSSSLRRRPASPLHNSTSAAPPTSLPASVIEQNVPLSMSLASSGSNSPSMGPQRFNETYPPLHHYASSSSFSSIPSTPTSQRSRSPSISSLETIEDAPEMESEAIENERIERLKLAAERAERAERGENVDDDSRRRSSLDVPRGFGFSRGGNRERKRWSVCGGERRADLDLETIWED
ncbi:Hypothetical predicted protein [Lecanosticta acicola]|uniref:Basic proline-rich protein n=1 Tax=Lecanosticta acicola TaxID=111012 RepID=A0AAI9EEU3_9PEZI|nr:Hypothetical predicted protein [Lecanosticta acicola]